MSITDQSKENGKEVVIFKKEATAVLVSCTNSYKFDDRCLVLDKEVKIGRSANYDFPAPNNAIFDSKVLSRNHALLWFENGKFYVKDTKSSNGTFVNNERLSKASRESKPREVYTGDILQLGIPVTENYRKRTHACIVAILKLYMPDGSEAVKSLPLHLLNTAQERDFYLIHQCIQTGLQRERALERKLSLLQEIMKFVRSAFQQRWEVLLREDDLLSRIGMLERELQTHSKNYTKDTLRGKIKILQYECPQYNEKGHCYLRKLQEEKLEAMRKVEMLENSLILVNGKCSHLNALKEKCEADYDHISDMYYTSLETTESLRVELENTKKTYEKMCENLKKERDDLIERIKEKEIIARRLQKRNSESGRNARSSIPEPVSSEEFTSAMECFTNKDCTVDKFINKSDFAQVDEQQEDHFTYEIPERFLENLNKHLKICNKQREQIRNTMNNLLLHYERVNATSHIEQLEDALFLIRSPYKHCLESQVSSVLQIYTMVHELNESKDRVQLEDKRESHIFSTEIKDELNLLQKQHDEVLEERRSVCNKIEQLFLTLIEVSDITEKINFAMRMFRILVINMQSNGTTDCEEICFDNVYYCSGELGDHSQTEASYEGIVNIDTCSNIIDILSEDTTGTNYLGSDSTSSNSSTSSSQEEEFDYHKIFNICLAAREDGHKENSSTRTSRIGSSLTISTILKLVVQSSTVSRIYVFLIFLSVLALLVSIKFI